MAPAAHTRKYALGWTDGAAVRAYVAKGKAEAIAEMLDEHFLAHPLARLDRGVNPTARVIGDIDLAHVFDGDDADPETRGDLSVEQQLMDNIPMIS